VAKYRLTPIAQLAHQLSLSPARLRLRQIEGAEYLLDLIDSDKGYPYDFVCYHITGYRPRRSNGTGHGTLGGHHLITDLVQLVEDLSASPMVDTTALPEPAWSTEQLARRLRVSTKTVCRWRRRGLAGRKLRFPDGTIRVAFVERCVRRFVRRNLAMVLRGAAFKQLTTAEKRNIIERAREILGQRRIRLHELSQKIAAEMHRAVETVRYTLRRFDREHPDQALFGKNEQPIIRPEHQALYEAYRAGEPSQRLAERLGMPVSAVDQIIREIRARQLLARPLDCIYSHEFDAPNADQLILTNGQDDNGDGAAAPTPVSVSGVPRDLPPYLRDLYREPLLTAKQERNLFRRYNYLKFKAAKLRERIDPLRVTEKQLKAAEDAVGAAEIVKDQITRANLRLVVSIARRHVGPSRNGPEFLEIVSDGNLSLMRAVEKFDYSRGYKFSTYASWAIMRNYARTIPESLYRTGRQVTGNEELLDGVADTREPERDSIEVEGIRRTLERCLAQLTDRERAIVVRHFGLKGEGQGETLDQIGKGYGVTKERIRQIERSAIKRLREILLEERSSLAVGSG
jgi:RNA polymerase primary sigma factor